MPVDTNLYFISLPPVLATSQGKMQTTLSRMLLLNEFLWVDQQRAVIDCQVYHQLYWQPIRIQCQERESLSKKLVWGQRGGVWGQPRLMDYFWLYIWNSNLCKISQPTASQRISIVIQEFFKSKYNNIAKLSIYL